jgi:hypothetical protein
MPSPQMRALIRHRHLDPAGEIDRYRRRNVGDGETILGNEFAVELPTRSSHIACR